MIQILQGLKNFPILQQNVHTKKSLLFNYLKRAFHRSQDKFDKIPKLNLTKSNATAEMNKDNLLYVSENKSYFRLMNVFALSQLFFWSFTAYSFHDLKDGRKVNKSEITEKDSKLTKELSWFTKIDLVANKNIISCLSFTIGKSGFIINFKL